MSGKADYTKTSGGLKLKGAGQPAKKKKKSSASKRLREEESKASGSGSAAEHEEGGEGEGEERVRSLSPVTAHDDGKTDAQRRFEEVQRKRLLEKAAKGAAKTHKERVAEFNEKLENLSEHYDIPKVGPG